MSEINEKRSKRIRIYDQDLIDYIERKQEETDQTPSEILSAYFNLMQEWVLDISKAGFKNIAYWRDKVTEWEQWYRANIKCDHNWIVGPTGLPNMMCTLCPRKGVYKEAYIAVAEVA